MVPDLVALEGLSGIIPLFRYLSVSLDVFEASSSNFDDRRCVLASSAGPKTLARSFCLLTFLTLERNPLAMTRSNLMRVLARLLCELRGRAPQHERVLRDLG